MKEWTCSDCGNRGSCPDGSEIMPFPELEICINFKTKDGKRPRFCRLAGSVDEMAAAIVYKAKTDGVFVFLCPDESITEDRYEARSITKKWLMEVE